MANMKTIAQNKKARHDYFVEETYEAGIELCGTEVKSLRAGRVNLKTAGVQLLTAKFLSTECTFLLTNKETSLTVIRCV